MTPANFDLVIVGSGFGGAVCALRAAHAGLRVLVLERGRRMTPHAYELLATGRLPAFHSRKGPGLIELHRLSGLVAVDASAVGGGSHIYTAVTVPAPREVFDESWPVGVCSDSLAPYYARVAEMISPTPIPQVLSRTTALEELGRRLVAPVTRLPLAMVWPSDLSKLHHRPSPNGVLPELSAWLQGGHAARKRTLAQTYLPQAEALGASILPLHEVQAIIHQRGGYNVQYCCLHDGQWRDGEVHSPRVAVAAGALGTVGLLLRCRDTFKTLPELSPALGQRVFTNGDFGGLLIEPTPAPSLDAGPPVTAWIDHWADGRLFVMETGLIPYDVGSFAGLLNPARWLGGLQLTPNKACTWSFGVMGFEANPGAFKLSRRGKLIHRRDPAGSIAYRQRMTAVLTQFADAARARLVTPPAFIANRLPITVHPLGGAVMADGPDRGVVNPLGEVFSYPGLYVLDGSIVPTPTGVPPSMTIAALAERIAENLIKQC
jgi:cholesterol oxidase